MNARIVGFCLLVALSWNHNSHASSDRPNVLLIMTDDQGYGDLGFHGNPKIRTPNLDRLARESVRFSRFYVSPVCAPTRASLLTGRYAYRTGVVDTFLGRALMYPGEVTLAEMLGSSGYHTGIFGKWHLGDNYPMRTMDQGFQESLVLRGGGIGQPSDPDVAGGESYFDPVLQHNGREIKTKGYCSDIFTDATIDFITKQKDHPFFAYLAFNAPHTPLQVPERDHLPYKSTNFTPEDFPKTGHPLPPNIDQDATSRVYGMVSNIDANLGRLFAKLESLGLAEKTLVIFLTDNGPQQARYNGGMRDLKGTVYEGGIRVPCFVRWPGHFTGGKVVEQIAMAFDLTPTILEACEVSPPAEVSLDGRSLLPLLEGKTDNWPDRTIYLQWHRGDAPERLRAFAAESQRYKLLRPESATKQPLDRSLELYDMTSDPLELHNIAAQFPEVVARLRASYEAWFQDVGHAHGYAPSRIVLGAPEENPSTLTRQDWRGPRAGWNPNDQGYWEVDVARSGTYEFKLRFPPRPAPTTVHFELAGVSLQQDLKPNAGECTFDDVSLRPGPSRLQAWIAQGNNTAGVLYVTARRAE